MADLRDGSRYAMARTGDVHCGESARMCEVQSMSGQDGMISLLVLSTLDEPSGVSNRYVGENMT